MQTGRERDKHWEIYIFFYLIVIYVNNIYFVLIIIIFGIYQCRTQSHKKCVFCVTHIDFGLNASIEPVDALHTRTE